MDANAETCWFISAESTPIHSDSIEQKAANDSCFKIFASRLSELQALRNIYEIRSIMTSAKRRAVVMRSLRCQKMQRVFQL